MSTNGSNTVGVYELPLQQEEEVESGEKCRTELWGALPESILWRSTHWFCRLRWIVIGILLFYGLAGYLPAELYVPGLQRPGSWPFIMAALLVICNVFFLIHARSLENASDPERGEAINLWSQIVIDLCILTAVVHFLGGVETYFAFAYLFHIALACIFFPRAWSFMVTMLACALFTLSVVLDVVGILPEFSIFTAETHPVNPSAVIVCVNVISAQIIWLVVWYLTSRLSALVRTQDAELAQTNRQLVQAQEERSKHMLQTTHELKAPFSAIHANADLLLKGYYGPLPDEIWEVVSRISARARRVAREIHEMLQLANINAPSQQPYEARETELNSLLERCYARLTPLAEEKNIKIETDFSTKKLKINSVEDHLQLMFDNLLNNAVMYANSYVKVTTAWATEDKNAPCVTIEDDGIGIPQDKIPNVFEEYYRTNEAVRHCRESTGLGLAIVKSVAQLHQIRVRISSEPGKGTRFRLVFSNLSKAAGVTKQ